MNTAPFFGVGPVFPWVGTSPAVDLAVHIGPNLDYAVNAGSKGVAVLHFTSDTTFSALRFANQSALGSIGDATTKTYLNGTELVAVEAYTVATGSVIAYHSK